MFHGAIKSGVIRNSVSDQMYIYILSDLMAKARAYGSFGHQSMFDENRPFKISRFAGQTATTLMNFNNILRSVPIQ